MVEPLNRAERAALEELGVDIGERPSKVGEGQGIDEAKRAIEEAGVQDIAAAAPASWDEVDVWGFLTTPQPDLEGPDGVPTTPLDWFRSNGERELVIQLLKEI